MVPANELPTCTRAGSWEFEKPAVGQALIPSGRFGEINTFGQIDVKAFVIRA
jgi:hypothetical protein